MSRQIHITSSSSNISIDSLERDFIKKTSINHGRSEENVDTILVPFYEKDVLMKVPKEQKVKKVSKREGKSSDRLKIESQNSSYLVNKHKPRRTSYLEMFRKQIAPLRKVEKKPNHLEIRSLSPEVGDTERESISEDPNVPATEFYNTESYNEIYYEKIMCQDLVNYMDNSYEDLPPYTEGAEVHSKNEQDMNIENLRSVSDVSQVRRYVRRTTEPHIDNVKLGGLGPDMERIKPRLERARSLQRYSEKVRMENRLKIYKKSVQVDNEKKLDKEISTARRRNRGPEQKIKKDDHSASYLMNNKSSQKKSEQLLNKVYSSSRAGEEKRSKIANQGVVLKNKSGSAVRNENHQASTRDTRSALEVKDQKRAKSSTRNKGINTDRSNVTPDVHINFMVNLNRGARPSSALRTLEDKHRMYQERVKAFNMGSNL